MAYRNRILNRIVKHTKEMRRPCLEVRQKQGFHDFMLKYYLEDHTFNNYASLMCVCKEREIILTSAFSFILLKLAFENNSPKSYSKTFPVIILNNKMYLNVSLSLKHRSCVLWLCHLYKRKCVMLMFI